MAVNDLLSTAPGDVMERWRLSVKAMVLHENGQRERIYRDTHRDWLLNVDRFRASGIIPPFPPVPPPLVKYSETEAGEPVISYGPEPVIDPLLAVSFPAPGSELVAGVGSAIHGAIGMWSPIVGDNAPDGWIVAQGARRFRKRAVHTPFGVSQWYEEAP